MQRALGRDEILLCRLEAEIFESSIDFFSGSSEIFIRRFAHSSLALRFDSKEILDDNAGALKCLTLLEDEFGDIRYGKEKIGRDQMHWMGYMYRCFSLLYGVSSKEAYRILSPKSLLLVHQGYHTMSCPQAIARMLEVRGLSFSPIDEEEKFKSIYRRFLKEEKLLLR